MLTFSLVVVVLVLHVVIIASELVVSFIAILLHGHLLVLEHLLLALLLFLPLFLLGFDLLSEQGLVLEYHLLLHQDALIGVRDVLEHLIGLWELPEPVGLEVERHISSVHIVLVPIVEL